MAHVKGSMKSSVGCVKAPFTSSRSSCRFGKSGAATAVQKNAVLWVREVGLPSGGSVGR